MILEALMGRHYVPIACTSFKQGDPGMRSLFLVVLRRKMPTARNKEISNFENFNDANSGEPDNVNPNDGADERNVKRRTGSSALF